MNTCETCRSWEPIRSKAYGECVSPKVKNEGEPPIDGLAEADTLGTAPMIYTGPRFGCVHWAPKKEKRAA